MLSGLGTIILLPPDCNYAFKHTGNEMKIVAEQTQSLAQEQYESRRAHHSIDLAVNKSLTSNII
jgi:hypothetical protein